jgi:hypothetical protein
MLLIFRNINRPPAQKAVFEKIPFTTILIICQSTACKRAMAAFSQMQTDISCFCTICENPEPYGGTLYRHSEA